MRDLGFVFKEPYFSRLSFAHDGSDTAHFDDLYAGFERPSLLDSDQDGLWDELEDFNGNLILEDSETDPYDSDSDDDGLLDSIEPDLELNPRTAESIIANLIEVELASVGRRPLNFRRVISKRHSTHKTAGWLLQMRE